MSGDLLGDETRSLLASAETLDMGGGDIIIVKVRLLVDLLAERDAAVARVAELEAAIERYGAEELWAVLDVERETFCAVCEMVVEWSAECGWTHVMSAGAGPDDYDHRVSLSTPDAPNEPSEEQVEAFRSAWLAADAEGRTGERVRDGLMAVLAAPVTPPETCPTCKSDNWQSYRHRCGDDRYVPDPWHRLQSRRMYESAAAPSVGAPE